MDRILLDIDVDIVELMGPIRAIDVNIERNGCNKHSMYDMLRWTRPHIYCIYSPDMAAYMNDIFLQHTPRTVLVLSIFIFKLSHSFVGDDR